MSSSIEFPGKICYCADYGFWEKQQGYKLDPNTGWWVHTFCLRPARWAICTCVRCNIRFVPEKAVYPPYNLVVACPDCTTLLAEAPMPVRYPDIPRIKYADGRTHVNISNSEVASYLKCERRHFYGFRLGLVPKSMSRSLLRGTVGHEGLAEYYLSLQRGDAPEDAPAKAIIKVRELAMQDLSNAETYSEVIDLLNRYFQWCQTQDNFEVLDVERMYYMPIMDGHHFSMRLDMLVRFTSGAFMGEVVLFDHKFVYDFWPENAMTINAQIPKYLGALKFNNVPVRRAIINQIRTRVNKGPMADSEKFRRSQMNVGMNEIKNLIREQIIASERILALNALSEDEHSARVLRAMDRFTCENCPFLALCKADLNGEDTSLMRQVEFQKQEDQPEHLQYGYNTSETSNG